jgi:hypothetical protein
MARKYCIDCKRYIETKKNFGLGGKVYFFGYVILFGFLGLVQGLFNFALIWLVIGPIIYATYHIFGKPSHCPLCNGKALSNTQPKEQPSL